MPIVVIAGWVPGFEKVSCTKLLRSRLGLGLRDGKQMTDNILARSTQRIELQTDAAAMSLVSDLAKIGALAHVEPVA
jgi:ribosomal protein L7/L12